MFCEKCGNELEKDVKFCPKCGKQISLVQKSSFQYISKVGFQRSSNVSAEEGKLLYESRGISKKRTAMVIIISIIFIFVGSCFLWLSQSTYSEISVISSFGRGTIGGGYRFNEEGRKMLNILGIICMVYGLASVINFFTMKKPEFQIYENFIQGVQYFSILGIQFKKEFQLEYYQIVEIQKISNFMYDGLRINTATEKYGVILKYNALEPYQLIKMKMAELH